MPYPTNAGELQPFLCSTNWMRDSSVDYARLACPLQNTLDQSMAKASRRTKRVAAGIPVALTKQECEAYVKSKQALVDAATQAFPKPDAKMVLLTDASDVGWSVIVSQVKSWKSDADIHDQQLELLICLDGTFTGAQKNWNVIEKRHTQLSWRAISSAICCYDHEDFACTAITVS
ncbi:RNA-directed DNA polymerase [Phytophthora megakarya]|uniref:RNA-directed DNA polymerase n=1 Tax=Phytophthora megakarya TaxID=4795 RepID=A0A225WB66_9STRA|nr:RNA-directed DNA polymerase [Phytophthora megakarya]